MSAPKSTKAAKVTTPVHAPERTPEEQALVDESRMRTRLRRPPNVKPHPGGVETDADDNELWTVRLMKAAGVEDYHLAENLVSQVLNCISGDEPATKWNLAMAGMHSIGPLDGVEAMLAAQMVATHHAAMRFLQRAGNAEMLEQMTAAGAVAIKLLRTYAAQVEALNRYRNAGKQQITVQHIGITADNAAIAFGSVPAGGGLAQMEAQPHEARLCDAQFRAMPGPDSQRDAVPVAGHAERPLQNTRRQKPRRAKG